DSSQRVIGDEPKSKGGVAMKKVSWITDDIFFDEHGRLHILNTDAIKHADRIRKLRHTPVPVEINPHSIVISLVPTVQPIPMTTTCPDGMCVCRRDLKP